MRRIEQDQTHWEFLGEIFECPIIGLMDHKLKRKGFEQLLRQSKFHCPKGFDMNEMETVSLSGNRCRCESGLLLCFCLLLVVFTIDPLRVDHRAQYF